VKTDLRQLADSLPAAWRSTRLGRIGNANFKVLRMEGPDDEQELHGYDEALLVLDGQLNLRLPDAIVEIAAGEAFIVPAGTPHSIAPGSHGTLVIVDQDD
jgi:mannose-6-phosphate isomerase-like protein (cupin superfamily)